ncbi:MAG TPA: FAD:protein FMN transferase, partial [Flavitalea sp.]|nr:FAD:protein FMN transferase [Flavitalea sp.]
ILLRLDNSLSIYKDSSLISKFNRSTAGSTIDKHLYNVVSRSLEINKKTQGKFDITVKPLVQLWGFAARQPDHLPDSQELKSIMPCIGSKHLVLKKDFLMKRKICTEIDVNGIAQGYSVDVLASYIGSKGIKNYMVELGGELRVRGRKPDHTSFRVGIESPVEDAAEPALMQQVIQLSEGAITTSGSYRKFYESNGRRISHIIDPFTGYSAVTDLISVTVYASTAMTADGFDNAILMMGLKQGMEFVENHQDIAAFFIYRDGNGRVKSTASSRFKKLLVEK